MREKTICIATCFITLVAQTGTAHAEDVTFTLSGVIDSNDVYDTVYVYDFNIPPFPPIQTIVDVYGRADALFTYDSSAVNLFNDAGIYDYIYLHDSSSLNFCGGFWGASLGATGYLLAHNSSTVNIHDGLVGLGSNYELRMWDSSTANVYGGTATALIFCEDSTTINVYDAWLSNLCVYDTSTAHIYGGEIGHSYGFVVESSASVSIYGHSFAYDPEAEWDPGYGWWISRLTGLGADGTPITIWYIPDPCTHSNINLIPDFVLRRGVDFGDFAVLATAWRSSPGDGNWNPICDISDPNDGVIDERDLDVLTTYWLTGVK